MPSRFRSAVLASAVVATCLVPASALVAQDGKDPKAAAPPVSECNPNAVATQALAKATFSMQRAFQSVQAKRDATKDLKEAVTYLTTPSVKEPGDSVGRAYYLAQAYILMLQQPGAKAADRRGNYGIATDTSLTIDLLAAADTQITKVETWSATCRSEISKWRQQQPWLDALNGSIGALNSEHFDSAEVLAKRSLVIDRSAPYAYSVLASVANHRKDYDAAITNLKMAIQLSGTDTIYQDQRNSSLFELANTYTQRADAASGPEQKTKVQEAVKAWQEFMPLSTKDLQVATAVQLIRKMLKSVNDTASLAEAYAPIIANPAHYGESGLLNAGLVATQAKRPDDAVKLFSAVLDKNPYQRDALNNLAASYATVKMPEKMLPLVDKLVSLDPNNADNWLLYAYAYSGMVKDNKGAAIAKAYTDSLVKYNTKSEQLTPRLSLTAFSHTPKETSLSGSIENYMAKVPMSVSGKPLKGAKVATVPTKTFSLTVDFLDAQGNVLGTKTQSVGPVAPGSSEPFTVTLEEKDAVAFRYKPIQ